MNMTYHTCGGLPNVSFILV